MPLFAEIKGQSCDAIIADNNSFPIYNKCSKFWTVEMYIVLF